MVWKFRVCCGKKPQHLISYKVYWRLNATTDYCGRRPQLNKVCTKGVIDH